MEYSVTVTDAQNQTSVSQIEIEANDAEDAGALLLSSIADGVQILSEKRLLCFVADSVPGHAGGLVYFG